MANQMMFVGVACFCLVALLFTDEASARVMAPRNAPEMAPLGAPMYALEMASLLPSQRSHLKGAISGAISGTLEMAPEMAPMDAPEMAAAYSPEVSPVMALGSNSVAVSTTAPTHVSSVTSLVFTALMALHFL